MQPHEATEGDSRSSHQRPNRRRGQMFFAVMVMGLLLAGFSAVQRLKAGERQNLLVAMSETSVSSPLVSAVEVQSAPSSVSLKLPGDTAAWYASTIYARVDGYVSEWHVDIGDRVRKGQVLAVIDTPDLDAQMAAAEAKLKASLAQIASREAEAHFAKTTYERWRDSPKGIVSEQEREAKKASFESAEAHLNEAKAQNGLDRANVDRFRALEKFKQVLAPFNGIITERRIDIGNLVTAGSNASTTPLYRIEQVNPIRVFVEVPQSASGNMKAGMPVRIYAANIPNRVFEAKVSRTAEAIDQESRTLRVEVDLPNTDQALIPGMYVDVELQISREGLVQVPAAALIFRPRGPQVAVIDKDNKVTFRDVAIARDNGTVIDIKSGVAAGEKVGLNIGTQVAEGEKITLSVPSSNGPADVSKKKS